MLLVMVLIFVSGVVPAEPLAYFYHATLLSIFYVMQTGSLNLYHLWFVVHLMVYFIIFLAVDRLIRMESLRVYFYAALFALLAYLTAIGSLFSVEWKFIFFLWIFYAGVALGKKDRMLRLYELLDRKWLLLLIAVAMVMCMLGVPSVLTGNPILNDFVNSMSFILIRNIFVISSFLLSLWAVRKAVPLIRGAEAHINFIIYGLLFAYLIQPLVSAYLLYVINFTGWPVIDQTILEIPTGFAVAVVIAFFMQKAYDRLLKM
jgi:hypothetical protein